MSSRTAGIGIAAYHKRPRDRTFDLKPRLGPVSSVWRIAALCNKTFQFLFLDGLIKIDSAGQNIFTIADRSFATNQIAQELLSILERQIA